MGAGYRGYIFQKDTQNKLCFGCLFKNEIVTFRMG